MGGGYGGLLLLSLWGCRVISCPGNCLLVLFFLSFWISSCLDKETGGGVSLTSQEGSNQTHALFIIVTIVLFSRAISFR